MGIHDRELVQWAGLNPDATKVDRHGKKVSDVGARALAASCPNLTQIIFWNTQITDAGAQALAESCRDMIWIDLWLVVGEYTATTAFCFLLYLVPPARMQML